MPWQTSAYSDEDDVWNAYECTSASESFASLTDILKSGTSLAAFPLAGFRILLVGWGAVGDMSDSVSSPRESAGIEMVDSGRTLNVQSELMALVAWSINL